MIAKLVRRLIIIWCLWGVIRLCIFMHPFLMGVAKRADPNYFVRSPASVEDGAIVWFILLLGAIVVVVIVAAIHCFSSWLFKENE